MSFVVLEKHTSLRKMRGISSFFKKTWKVLKWPFFCCCETRVEPFVPLQEDSEPDSEPDPEPADHKPHFVAEPFGFKPAYGKSAAMITVVPCKTNKQAKPF